MRDRKGVPGRPRGPADVVTLPGQVRRLAVTPTGSEGVSRNGSVVPILDHFDVVGSRRQAAPRNQREVPVASVVVVGDLRGGTIRPIQPHLRIPTGPGGLHPHVARPVGPHRELEPIHISTRMD